ncbi:noggin-like [Amia ocellicauda]|uniref:noggin-like n=1 Tax=Amia ocellicauda TaxID=2972642 RepID=UPI003464077B
MRFCLRLPLFCTLFLSLASLPSPSPPQQASQGPQPRPGAPPDWDLSFLRSRPASSLSAYSLSLDPRDYQYVPKPKHVRPSRLLRVLGSSYDPFWMSIEKPAQTERAGEATAAPSEQHPDDHGPGNNDDQNHFNYSVSPELREGTARYQRKLEQEARDLDLDLRRLPGGAAQAELFRAWLVAQASCQLTHRWLDLGPVFWPRWVRHTDCQDPAVVPSCSFPAGMACRRAQVTQIKILAWHCWGATATGGEVGGRCQWRQVPYPVVTACKCSCLPVDAYRGPV